MCAPPPSRRLGATASSAATLALRLVLTVLALWLAWAQLQPSLVGRAVTVAPAHWAQRITPCAYACPMTPG